MKLKLALFLIALVGFGASFAPAPAQDPPPVPVRPLMPPHPDPFGPSPGPPYIVSDLIYGGNMRPEEANVAQEADQLARKLAETKSDTEREKIKTQLGELLKQQFDLRQKRHAHEIEELEAQIKKLKNLVDKRQENRNEIIARRLEQILRESQGLGW